MRSRLVVIFISLALGSAHAQTDTDFVQTVKRKLERYKQIAPMTKVFLFFNQDTYAPGDTAFFAAHFLSEDMVPIDGRQILRLELIDHNSNLVLFENIAVKNGKGFNQAAIPQGLKPGAYQWVAYSDWMRNFDPGFYFRKDFLLIEKNNLAMEHSSKIALDFYPEGGTLVTSHPNNIVAVSHSPIGAPIKIVDQNGNEITQFDLNANGLAKFELTPTETNTYFAEVQYLGKMERIELPPVSKEGISIIMQPSKDQIQVNLRSPANSRVAKSNMWLVISSRSEIYFSSPFKFEDRGLKNLQFSTKELPSGICYATIFSDKVEMLAERLFLNNSLDAVTIAISRNNEAHSPRSNIEIIASLKDSFGNPLQGEFAVSVLNKKLFTNFITSPTLDQYLYFNSELQGSASHQTYSPEEIDMVLISQKNMRLDWKSIVDGSFHPEHYFTRLIQYSGSIVNKENGKPVTDSTLLVAYLQKGMIGYEATTDKEGKFDLIFLFDFWNDDDIFYSVKRKDNQDINATVLWDTDPVSRFIGKKFIEEKAVNSYANFSSRKRHIDFSYDFYDKQQAIKTISMKDPNREFEDELSGTDYSVNVEEYVMFPTMEELIREVVPSLQHRKTKKNSIVRVVLRDGAIPIGDPLFIIDGIMTKNSSYFLQLKPADLVSIKIVRSPNKLNRFGTLGQHGIVLVLTKGIDHKNLRSDNTSISVKGINKPITTFQSRSVSSNSRVPDFRSTVYWNPSIVTNSDGVAKINFSMSDDSGNLLILIQGITTNGRPFSKVDSLNVIFKKN